MVEAALQTPAIGRGATRRSALRRAFGRKSTIAFLMTLPLILLVALLVLYPALYSIHLATLNKSMERFVGFGNFLSLRFVGSMLVPGRVRWSVGAASAIFFFCSSGRLAGWWCSIHAFSQHPP